MSARKSMQAPEVVKSFKGFDKDFKCRDFQFAVGETYTHTGAVKACHRGFHACENPLDVFTYYEPGKSRFASVEQAGQLSRHDDDSKVASSQIAIKLELTIPAPITAAFEYVRSKCEPATSEHATGDRSASSATGYSSASSATGISSASSATGDRSASSATGIRSASSATGYSSASSATGISSASLTTGGYSRSEILPSDDSQHAVAVALGYASRVRAPIGSGWVLAWRGESGELLGLVARIVGQDGIKPDVWYELNEQGEPREVQQ